MCLVCSLCHYNVITQSFNWSSHPNVTITDQYPFPSSGVWSQNVFINEPQTGKGPFALIYFLKCPEDYNFLKGSNKSSKMFSV